MGNLPLKQKWTKIKSYYNEDQHQSFFSKQQSIEVTETQLNRSIDFAIMAKKEHYHSIRQIWKTIHPLLLYLTHKRQKFQAVDKRIKQNLQSLVSSAFNVLKMQDHFLKKVTPINISYFHFMRSSDLYLNYVAMRYVLCVGNIRKKDKISVFDGLNEIQTVKMFKHIINWLYQMISYKFSAIYIKNDIVDHLIEVTFLVLCGLLGGQQNIILSIQRTEREYIYNQLFYIVVYIFCKVKNQGVQKNIHLFQIAAITICRVINSCDSVNISLFSPSFWYIDMFGLIKSPTVNEIMLLLSFQIIQQSLNFQNQNSFRLQDGKIRTITILLSHLAYQLVSAYKTSNPKIVERYLKVIVSHVSIKSIARAYLTPILGVIDPTDTALQLYYKVNKKKSYCIENKVINMQITRKNWFQCERRFYFAYLYSAIQGRQLLINQSSIWQLMLYFNQDLISQLQNLDGIDSGQQEEQSERLKQEYKLHSEQNQSKAKMADKQ